MLPAVVAGAMVASAAVQWYNSEQARNADKKERKRMQDLINKVQQPDFDFRSLAPEDIKVVGKYIPEVAPYVAEQAPELVKESGIMKEGQAAQLAALRRYRDIAQTGQDPMLQMQMDMASRQAGADAQSRQRSILEGQARRGQAGTLQSLVAQMQGTESANERNAQMQREAAMAAYKNQLNALNQSAALGGQVRADDINLQRSNNDIINQFNERMAQRGQQYGQYASGLRNEAQLKNLGARQAASDQNIMNRYNAARENQANTNRLLQQRYGNDLNKLGLQSNQIQSDRQAIMRDAADRNQAIQGVTNAFTSYGANQMANDQQQSQMDFEKKKLRYQQTGDEGIWG